MTFAMLIMIGLMAFGSKCFKIIQILPAPIVRLAITNSDSLRENTCPLKSLAVPIHPVAAMAIIIGKIPGLMIRISSTTHSICGMEAISSQNFDEDYYGDFLGFWNCADKQMNIYEFIDGQMMSNARFRNFREHNKLGNDFVVLSKQKLIDITNNK